MSSDEDEDSGTELERELRARLRIDPQALDEEFRACPADVAYLGALHARRIEEHLRAKSRAKRTRGLVYIEARRRLIAAHGTGRGGATEELIKAEVEQDSRVQEADEDEISAEVGRERGKADFAAVMAKKDMLVQLGATYRAEMERDPMIARDRREARHHPRREG